MKLQTKYISLEVNLKNRLFSLEINVYNKNDIEYRNVIDSYSGAEYYAYCYKIKSYKLLYNKNKINFIKSYKRTIQ